MYQFKQRDTVFYSAIVPFPNPPGGQAYVRQCFIEVPYEFVGLPALTVSAYSLDPEETPESIAAGYLSTSSAGSTLTIYAVQRANRTGEGKTSWKISAGNVEQGQPFPRPQDPNRDMSFWCSFVVAGKVKPKAILGRLPQ